MSEKTSITGSNEYVENELRRRLAALEKVAGDDVFVCVHPIMTPFDDLIRNAIEDIVEKSNNLFVILETDGGSIEVAERISNVFRHHYTGEVSFLVASHAMSAGTVLVMSGDNIYMDYYSTLGPIDPQIVGDSGAYVPGLGYLEKYEELVTKSHDGVLSQAELLFLFEKFDPGQLHRLEQAREHSVDLLIEWLVKYKFKNWTKTEERGVEVDDEMKIARAREIAGKLNDTKRWRSHGRGIHIDTVRDILKLKVEDFGDDARHTDMKDAVRSYYRLLQDYMGRRGANFAIHSRERFLAL